MSRKELARLGGDILGDQTARDPESSKRGKKRGQQKPVQQGPVRKQAKTGSDDDEARCRSLCNLPVDCFVCWFMAGTLAVCVDREDEEQDRERDHEHVHDKICAAGGCYSAENRQFCRYFCRQFCSRPGPGGEAGLGEAGVQCRTGMLDPVLHDISVSVLIR